MAKKPAPDPQSCEGCKHFLQNEKDEFGYCRRYPPVPTVDDGVTVTAWLVLHASDLCGEFSRKLNS